MVNSLYQCHEYPTFKERTKEQSKNTFFFFPTKEELHEGVKLYVVAGCDDVVVVVVVKEELATHSLNGFPIGTWNVFNVQDFSTPLNDLGGLPVFSRRIIVECWERFPQKRATNTHTHVCISNHIAGGCRRAKSSFHQDNSKRNSVYHPRHGSA
jgi:hypothetical protein